MKLAKLAIASLLFSLGTAHGVIVSVNTGAFAGAVSDASNTPIANGAGYISVGVFSGLNDGAIATSLISTIDTAYTEFTASVGTFGNSGFAGFVNFATSGLRVDGPDAGGTGPDAYFNQNIYVVMGNGTTLLNSTQLAIFKASILFPDDNDAALDAAPEINLLTTPGTWVMGGPSGGNTNVGGFDVPNAATMALVAVPEPSIALLGLIGVVGFIRRRR
jgi:hypothetical protein